MNREIDQFCIDYWESVVYSDEEDTKTNPKPAKPESVTDSIGDDDPDWPDYEEIKAQVGGVFSDTLGSRYAKFLSFCSDNETHRIKLSK